MAIEYTPHNCDDFDPNELDTYIDCLLCDEEARTIEQEQREQINAEELGDDR